MLEDSSFAIHPGKKAKIGNTPFQTIGKIVKEEETDNGYRFHCENGIVDLLFYRDDIVRMVMNPKETPSLDGSRAVVLHQQEVKVNRLKEENKISFKTTKLEVTILESPFRVTIKDQNGKVLLRESDRGMGYQESGEVICYKDMNDADRFYGFGEKAGFLDKKGEKLTMWNTDVYAPHNPETDALYESIPYFMVLNNGSAYGVFFDNPSKTTFDMKSNKEQYSFMADVGQLDYYVFAGPTPKDVIEQYTALTGRMPLPPKWAIGYHQSRYSYETEAEVRELAQTFIEKGIPVDVIYLDIHYMDEYRVFTFDRDRFPNPEKMVEDLKQAGIRIVPIVDPGVKKDPDYNIYREGIHADHFCKYIEGDLYFGEVWPGTSTFPDFTDESVRKWWGEKHEFYSKMGIEGIWNDMNEPAVFNETKTMDVNVMHKNDGNPKTHRALHNAYGLLMGKATYEGMKTSLNGKRPFLLTRAGYAGVQRYAAVWTGDNRSFWEHLQLSLPMCMNLGLSGVPFTGPDVGGFAHDTSGELLTRWTQVGAFTPYFRNHSAIESLRQEPWQFGEKYERIIKKYIQMRYQWMPQLYSLFYQAQEKGLPIMRPLMLEYPNDPKTYQLNDQFMIGDNVMIAPIMSPEVTDRAVYFPEGQWIDYFSGETYEGKQVHLIYAELEKLPLFIRRGTIIANGKTKQSAKQEDDQLIFHVYAYNQGSYDFTFYDDDGETFSYQNDDFFKLPIVISSETSKIELELGEVIGNYQPKYKEIKFIIHQLEENQSVVVNGKTVDLDKTTNGVKFTIPLR